MFDVVEYFGGLSRMLASLAWKSSCVVLLCLIVEHLFLRENAIH